MYACRSGSASISALQHVGSAKPVSLHASPFFYFFSRPTERLSSSFLGSSPPCTNSYLRSFSTIRKDSQSRSTSRMFPPKPAASRFPKTSARVTRRKSSDPVGNDFIEGNPSNSIARSGETAKKEDWMIQKAALDDKFSNGWDPRKRLSPDALDGIRALHAQQPDVYTTEVLANEFEVSAEAIRRILKSKWRPRESEAVKRRQRWERRGESIWTAKIATGYKAPKRWRDMMRHRAQESGDDGVAQMMKHRAARGIVERDAEIREKEREEQRKAMEERESLIAQGPDKSNSNG